jgi:sortase A
MELNPLPQRKKATWKLVAAIIAATSMLGGAYLLLVATAPLIPRSPEIILKKLNEQSPKENRLYIPKIGVDVPFSNGISALETGAWHRFPERGDPIHGGNFILSAHRFRVRPTPEETRKSSAFYYINKINIGDTFVIDYKKKRYTYSVVKKLTVKPNQIEIEAPSNDAKLTLYACTLLGSNDGREVFIAKLKP